MPEVTTLTALALGFLLGVRHALDADHIVAVTAIVSRTPGFIRSLFIGLSWGIGHTLTLFVVGFVVLVFKLAIPDKLAIAVEFLVGVILVLLGISVLKELVVTKAHIHEHQHGDRRHTHSHAHGETQEHDHWHLRRPLLVGMVHGLAGSGALTVLVLSTLPSVVQGLFFFLFFGVGSILGMLIFSGLISLSFKFTAGFSFRLNLWFQGVAGLSSVLFGLFLMWQIGFNEGLFLP